MDPLRNIPRLSELSGLLRHLPTTDRGTFATLTSVPDIQAWTTAKADEYRQFSLALLAIHNLAAPIHHLPTEVIEQILELYWRDWKSLGLLHVCRLRRSILLARVRFWANVVADCELLAKREIVRDEVPLIDTLLSLSTRHSRAIRPSFYRFPPSIVTALSPYINNVVSLTVVVSKSDMHEGLWPFLLSGVPNLESLEIQLTITKEELDKYYEEASDSFWTHFCETWRGIAMLSRENLPKLSRLTCPQATLL